MALVQSNSLYDDDDDAEAAHHLSLIMYSSPQWRREIFGMGIKRIFNT